MVAQGSGARRFGHYQVVARLGTGRIAATFRAVNTHTGAEVALKILHAALSERPGARGHFLAEADRLAQLRHPHILAPTGYGEHSRRLYLETPFMPRGTLAARFAQSNPIGTQEALRLLRQAGMALDFAHRQWIGHGGVSLENIFLDEAGQALLGDFGVCRLVDDPRLTQTGDAWRYAAPEQAAARGDVRADLYGLAVVAYALFAGCWPFAGAPAAAAPPPSQANPDLPPALDAALLKGLAARPEARYASADMLVEALGRALADHPPFLVTVDLSRQPPAPPDEVPPARTADDWVDLAQAAADPAEQIACLKRALALAPLHSRANRLLFRLEGARPLASPLPAPAALPPALEPLKPVRRRRPRSGWSLVALGGFVLLAATSAFFVLSFFGSPLASQVAGVLSGQRPADQINGTPIEAIPNVVLTVTPSRVREIQGEGTMDTLDAGITHEYQFRASYGQEAAIYVQFASPTAGNVAPNVAVLRPDGSNAAPACQQDQLTSSGSAAFLCRIDQSGAWKVRVIGISGQSTGAYFIAAQTF